MSAHKLFPAFCAGALLLGGFALSLKAQQPETRLTDAAAKTVTPAAPRTDAAASLPTAQELLQKSAEATGGEEAWKKTTSRRLKGLYQSEDSSVFLGMEILEKSPNKSLTKITLPNGMTIRDVCDGRTAWIENSARGYQEYTGPALAAKLRQANFQDPGSVEKSARAGKVTGMEKVGAHNTYVLEFDSEKKIHSKLYFDTDSGLIVHTEDVISTPEGPYPVKIDLDDYREVDGLKFPFRMKRTEKGSVILIRVTQVTVNPLLDDTIFLKPDFAK
jgi:zinc protease